MILGLARENPRWGYLRIVGEPKKLGVTASKGAPLLGWDADMVQREIKSYRRAVTLDHVASHRPADD